MNNRPYTNLSGFLNVIQQKKMKAMSAKNMAAVVEMERKNVLDLKHPCRCGRKR